MQNYKTKLTRPALEGIARLIFLVQKFEHSQDDKLLICVLTELLQMFNKKMCDIKKEYSITLSPAQAHALMLLSINTGDHTSYTGNRLHQIANEVHQKYQ